MAIDPPPLPEPPVNPRRRRRAWPWGLGVVVVAIVAVVALWDWDWFLPLVDSQASAALGRTVTAQHLRVSLGRTISVSLDGVDIVGEPGGKSFADIDRLTVTADVMAYLRSRQIVLSDIVVDHPVIEADQDAQGRANWPPGSGGGSGNSGPGPQIGNLIINDGHAHVVLAKLKADFNLDIATRTPTDAPAQLVVDAKGTYAAQPITGRFIGGALLSLRDSSHPYPIDLHVANGLTKVALTGTVQNPLNFAGADLTLDLSGPDMAQLTPLTGVPIPQTPPFSVKGKLDYADRKIRFTNFHGKLGNSDLNGDIAVDPTRPRPFVDATLTSHRVDLADLGGFIGTAPGKKTEANQSAQQKAELARTEASARLLPDTPINMPKLNFADVRFRYKGDHIEGRSVPLDDIVADFDITDGRIQIQPLSFAIGTGQIALKADLTPVSGHDVKAVARIDLRRVSIARLMASTHLVEGAGTISGNAEIDSTGNSLGSLLGHGNGGLVMGTSGGNLSALLVDFAGLEFGNALLSALGVPNRATIECFVGNFSLTNGLLTTKALFVDTSEAQISGTGDINLAKETIDYKLVTKSKHFSVGSLSTPIDIGGTLKNPSIAPEAGPLALKGGAAVGLGILFPPAALLATIQLGTGETGACQSAEAPVARGESADTVVGKKPPR